MFSHFCSFSQQYRFSLVRKHTRIGAVHPSLAGTAESVGWLMWCHCVLGSQLVGHTHRISTPSSIQYLVTLASIEAARLQIAKDHNQWVRDNGHLHNKWCLFLPCSNCSPHQVSPFASVLVQDQLTGKPYMSSLPVARLPLKQLGPSVWQNTTCVLFQSVHSVDRYVQCAANVQKLSKYAAWALLGF